MTIKSPIRLSSIEIVPSDVSSTYLDIDARRAIWSKCGMTETLEMTSRLFADLDLSEIARSRSDVEKDWASKVSNPQGKKIRRKLNNGNTILTSKSMIQCIREIVEFADESSTKILSTDDFSLCILSINQDLDLNLDLENLTLSEITDRIAIDIVAQQSFNLSYPFETLQSSAEETWRRGWSDLTPPKTLEDLGDSPCIFFENLTGMNMDDFLSLGWIFWNMVKHENTVIFPSDFLKQSGLSRTISDKFIELCTLSIDDLRTTLSSERGDENYTPWIRSQLQKYPFLRLADGSILLLRLEYAILRIFGDLPYRLAEKSIREKSTKTAGHFKRAMNDIFEDRVGAVLNRIIGYQGAGDGGIIITESEMKESWRDKKGQTKKICDFVFYRNNTCIVIDANNRHLMEKFAEGTGSLTELNKEIEEMFARGKFLQLTSTIRQLKELGIEKDGVTIDDETRFIPLVVAPDAGMPSNQFTEALIMRNSAPLVQEFNGSALPPTIIRWRELLILEGTAEKYGVDIFTLLANWRIASQNNPLIAGSIQMFVENNSESGAMMSEYERTTGVKFFETLRNHAYDLKWKSMSPASRKYSEDRLKKEGLSDPFYRTPMGRYKLGM